jgi:glycosyltransferase involved in cell wall biosynthesis
MNDAKVLVAHLGARKHYQEPLLFFQWGILDKFYTDFYSGNNVATQFLRNPTIYKNLPQIIKKGLERYEPSLEDVYVYHFPWFGYQYARSLRKASQEENAFTFIWAGQKFCQRIMQKGISDRVTTIYGYNSASLELFEYAQDKGIRCILDQTLAEWSLVHQLLLEEEKRWSGWSLSPFKIRYADLELLRREQEEQDLADRIICGSEFVKDSLTARGVNPNKISVVPLGRSKDNQGRQQVVRQTPQERGDCLRILFAGTVGLRKGIPYLLKALNLVHEKIPFTCKVAGAIEIQPERVAEYSHLCDFLGLVPRSEMARLYAWADVFVLPSICEGSAMVIYEALSWGLPVITTYNSGSIIRDGIDGYIVPIRDPEAIAARLLTIFEQKKLLIDFDFCEYLNQIYATSKQLLLDTVLN